MTTCDPSASNAHRMNGKTTWRDEGYAAGLNSHTRMLEPNPTDHHEAYVRGWCEAWRDRDDAAPALERILDDRHQWSSAGGWAYGHDGRELGDPDHDTVRARIADSIAVHVHPGMTPDTIEQEVIKVRRIHAAVR